MSVKAEIVERVLKMAVEIQQIPAPTFLEARRAAFVRERFFREGLEEVEQDPLANVYGRIPGDGSALPLVVSAHLDTVFPERDYLPVHETGGKITGPGIGDNSLGVAGLFGLLWGLRQRASAGQGRLPGDIWLVANVGEEGLGDLRGMKAVVERFGSQVQGYIILEGMALGQIYHRGLGVQRYRISLETTGGHSWANFGEPSAVHELAVLITRLMQLPLPVEPRTTLNVGVIHGGTSINTIAADAHMELDLRSEETAALTELIAQVEDLIHQANRPGVRVKAEIVGHRPAGMIPLNHPLVQLARHCLESQGMQPVISIGSTDANIPLSQGIPAVCVGLGTGGGAHTRNEYIDTGTLALGLEQLLALVEQVHSMYRPPEIGI